MSSGDEAFGSHTLVRNNVMDFFFVLFVVLAVVIIVNGHILSYGLRAHNALVCRAVVIIILIVGYGELLSSALIVAISDNHNAALSVTCGPSLVALLISPLIIVVCRHVVGFLLPYNTGNLVAVTKRLILVAAYTQLFVCSPLFLIYAPCYYEALTRHVKDTCRSNMKNIYSAYQQYLLEQTNESAIKTVSDLVPTYIKQEPKCPMGWGKSYIITNDTVICPVAEKYANHAL